MISASLKDADPWFTDLVSRAEAGEEVVLEREGRAVARLVAIETASEDGADRRKLFGALKGQFSSPTDEEWAAMDQEIIELFEESINRPLDEPARFYK